MSENIIKKYCSGEDIDSDTIKKEIELYMTKYIDEIEYDNKYKHYKLKEEEIWFTGDNLITRKQMYRRMKATETNIENDDLFSSFCFMPYVAGKGPRYDVNKMRNSTGGYFDNPFCFFKTLEKNV